MCNDLAGDSALRFREVHGTGQIQRAYAQCPGKKRVSWAIMPIITWNFKDGA